MMQDLTKQERKTLKALNTPKKIQDFLNTIPQNFEPEGDTCLSPRRVLRENRAHCIEGAMLAALALRLQGQPPLIMDLQSSMKDFDHVVTPFQVKGCWGAISKTNHGVLRYREPVYKSLRELAMSYFHEYFLDNGTKTLRTYSLPMNLSKFDKDHWMTSEESVWIIPNALNDVRHIELLNRSQIAGLRKADAIERTMGKLTEWTKPKR